MEENIFNNFSDKKTDVGLKLRLKKNLLGILWDRQKNFIQKPFLSFKVGLVKKKGVSFLDMRTKSQVFGVSPETETRRDSVMS